MSAMEPLGRSFDVVPIAASAALSLKNCVGITYVTTGSDTFTLSESATFGGSYTAPAALACNVYKSTNTAGTTAWALDNTLRSGVTVVSGGAITTCFFIPATHLSDGMAYLKLTPSGSGLVMAILGDLVVKRYPPNLTIKGA